MRTNTTILSFWESQSFLDYDVIIIGAGITGLSSAISLLEKSPKLKVLILEKSLFPSGASTKNAGFACFGSLTELLSDFETMGPAKTVELVRNRWKGLQKLRQRFTDEELGYEGLGGYELIKDTQLSVLDKLPEVNRILHPIFGRSVFENQSTKIENFGFDKQGVKALLLNPLEGQLDTGKTMDSLWQRATSLGTKILTGTHVLGWTNNRVRVESGTNETVEFKGEKVVVCTNAFSSEWLLQEDIVPGRGQVMITHPLPNLKVRGTFHMNEGYYYFRNVGNRVLLGGGRHLDVPGETTLTHGINPKIEQELKRILSEEILPNTPYEIAQQWSGIMAFGKNKEPILKWISPEVFIAVRLGGMGMALGSEIGERVSKEVLKNL